MALRCPDCGSTHIETVIQNNNTSKPFGVLPACCGYIVFGAWGLLCGLCGARERRETVITRRCAGCGRIL